MSEALELPVELPDDLPDLHGLHDMPELVFCGAPIADALQARYRRQRDAWRAENPDRGHEIDARCMYLAPPEFRVRIGGME